MNREQRRKDSKVGLNHWVVILHVKSDKPPLVGVEGSQPPLEAVAVHVTADGPTSAVGLACGLLWEDKAKTNQFASIVGAQCMFQQEFERLQKEAAANPPKSAANPPKADAPVREDIPFPQEKNLDNPETSCNNEDAQSSPQEEG